MKNLQQGFDQRLCFTRTWRTEDNERVKQVFRKDGGYSRFLQGVDIFIEQFAQLGCRPSLFESYKRNVQFKDLRSHWCTDVWSSFTCRQVKGGTYKQALLELLITVYRFQRFCHKNKPQLRCMERHMKS